MANTVSKTTVANDRACDLIRTTIDYELVAATHAGFNRFRIGGPTLHMQRIRFELAKQLVKALPSSIRQRYYMMAFVRQVFSREVLPISFEGSDLNSGYDITKASYKLGLQPILRVLDTIHQPATSSQRCCLRLTFTDTNSPAIPVFEFLHEVEHGGIDQGSENTFHERYAEIIVPDAKDLTWPPHSQTHASTFPNLDKTLRDFSTASRLFSDDQPLFVLGLPATTLLCAQFGLEANIVSYRSMIAAIYDLHNYRASFGDNTLTMLFRSHDPTSFATGMTLVSAERLEKLELEGLTGVLSKFHDEICGGLVKPTNASKKLQVHLNGIRGSADPGHEDRNRVSIQLCDQIAEYVRAHAGVDETDSHFLAKLGYAGAKHTLRNCIHRFLEACLAFCDERHEGRPQEFGLVLGNPYMFRYWPGARPLPIVDVDTNGQYQNLWIDRLVKQVHLIGDPQQRFLVLPFGAIYEQSRGVEAGAESPSFVLDLANFQQAIATWREGLFWSPTAKTFAYLTKRYPLTVAAIVGPGSQIRVFCGGRVVCYRDGKGWRIWRDPTTSIRARLMAGEARPVDKLVESERESSLGRLSCIIDVALHLSPMIRTDAHGGLFVWSSSPDTFRSREGTTGVGDGPVALQSLDSVEPARLDEIAERWLCGNKLLRASSGGKADEGSTQFEVDYEVAKLVLRASLKDGAVCLGGSECEVMSFGQRVILPGGGTAGDRGTKHATAEAFPSAVGEGAFAIAISADGPIHVYYPKVESHRCFVDPEE